VALDALQIPRGQLGKPRRERRAAARLLLAIERGPERRALRADDRSLDRSGVERAEAEVARGPASAADLDDARARRVVARRRARARQRPRREADVPAAG